MKMYTKTELESIIDAMKGKSFFEANPKILRDLALEQRALETYAYKTTPRKKILDGRHVKIGQVRYRYLYHRSEADNAKYTAFVSYIELYILALGNKNLEAVAAEYWEHNPRLSTMTYQSPEKTPTHARAN